MLRSIGKQSGVSIELVLEEEKEGYNGKDLQKRKVLSLEWEWGGDGVVIIISINVSSITYWSHVRVVFWGHCIIDNNIVIWNFECSKVSLQRYFSDTKAKRLLPFAPCDIYLVSSEYLLKYLANLFCLMHVFWSDRAHSREGLNVTSAGWQVIIINRGVMKLMITG